MKTYTMCTVQNRNHAERVVAQLFSAGLPNKGISALLPNTSGAAGSAVVYQPAALRATESNSDCGLGGTLGRLKGLGALALPGLDQLAVAGPLYAALSAAAARTVGLTDAFIRIGIAAFEARRFEAKVKGGNVLVFVHTDSDDARARVTDIFNAAYAVDVCSALYVAVPKPLPMRSITTVSLERHFSSTG